MTSQKNFILVLDVGTTGIKAFIFDSSFKLIAKSYRSVRKNFPRKGWVEQSPQEIIVKSIEVLKEVIKITNIPLSSLTSIGITNQRETVIAWDSRTGKSVYPAIVWEDTRTARICDKLRKKYNSIFKEKTGLSITPYFSATKLQWILANVPKVKQLYKNGRLLCGTVDSWIMWNLLEGKPHVTDQTNASRTLLYNIHTLSWDKKLLDLFDVPLNILPVVNQSKSEFGMLKKNILGIVLPVRAVCGDQQSGMFAAGTRKGSTKVTIGTGTFIMQSLGNSFLLHDNFFTTLIPNNNHPYFACETKIDETGVKIDNLIKNHKKLTRFLFLLAVDVNKQIMKLPYKPNKIIVDGGGTRDGIFSNALEKLSGIKIIKQEPFDGTALGAAMLAA